MQNAQDMGVQGFKRRSPISSTRPTYLNRYRRYRLLTYSCRCADPVITGGFHIDSYVPFAFVYILHLFLNGN